jgi:signal transduction histidine kinase
MFKRVRQLRIPLAAKCELLFGAAVILVIAAALLVPWQRMEQLTEQLNEKAAAMVARHAVGEHVIRQMNRAGAGEVGAGDVVLTTQSTDPGRATTIDGQSYAQPRLVPLSAGETARNVTRFELSALARFQKDPKLRFHARLDPNTDTYRYAQPLRASQTCAQCHGGIAAPQTVLASAGAPLEPEPSDDDEPARAARADAPPTTQPAPLIGIVSVEIPSQIATRQIVLNRVFLLTAGLLAGTIAIVIFYVVTTRLILQPVRVLQETAEKVSQGDLNIRSDINSGDEFQQLSETFNTMLVNLKNSADQLRGVNKSLDLKLGQLAESNVALYESNRLKSEFLASVSHELRTPLNSILGFAELLRDQVASLTSGGDGKLARYVQNIVVSGNNLLALINDLLDLAKIEAGRMEIRSEPLSVPDLFEALIMLLKPMTEQKNLTILASVGGDVPIMQSDPGKLQQVLYNFLSNAIKFSPSGERIELTAERDAEDSVKVSVTDRGPGIEADKQAVIFEKFRQLDAGVTRSHSGTGLGLAISRELATLLGGSIGVRSARGEGATFWIRLPVKIEAGQQDVRANLVLS